MIFKSRPGEKKKCVFFFLFVVKTNILRCSTEDLFQRKLKKIIPLFCAITIYFKNVKVCNTTFVINKITKTTMHDIFKVYFRIRFGSVSSHIKE